MGLFGNTRENKGKYEDIPDDQLNDLQLFVKRWQSAAPYVTQKGISYNRGCKQSINGALDRTFGPIRDLDDLFEMKAPYLYIIINNACSNIGNLCKYVYENLSANNQMHKVQGKYEQLQVQFQELKKRCISQKKLLEKTMEQNAELIKQNQELIEQNKQLQSLLPPAKKATASAAFAR